jgi:hypothetical protein
VGEDWMAVWRANWEFFSRWWWVEGLVIAGLAAVILIAQRSIERRSR